MRYQPLINFDERTAPINMIVFHCSAQSTSAMIDTLKDLKLSTHYIIGPQGGITKCVPDNKRAWHAGKSFWNGTENLNSQSIGIEICSPSLGQKEYNSAQIKSLIKLCKHLIKKYHIPAYNIIGHSDIAPTRKPDPGIAFPWKQLASSGIGIWYNIQNHIQINTSDITELLSIIGYDTRDKSTIQASAYAFCRHFLPQFVSLDNDIPHLLENILPQDFSFINNDIFINTLKSVAYAYCKASNNPCKI